MRRHSLPRAAGRAHGRCQEKRLDREKARERRDWRDPWRPVVGRTGRDQARSVRVGVQCLAMGGSTKAAPKRSDARPRTCDQRAASKRPAGLRAAGPRLPRSRGLCAAAVCAQSRYCGLAGRVLGGERALLGVWASGAQRRARATQPARGVADPSRPQAERAWRVLGVRARAFVSLRQPGPFSARYPAGVAPACGFYFNAFPGIPPPDEHSDFSDGHFLCQMSEPFAPYFLPHFSQRRTYVY